MLPGDTMSPLFSSNLSLEDIRSAASSLLVGLGLSVYGEVDAQSQGGSVRPDDILDRSRITVGSSPGDAQCLKLPAEKRRFGSITKADWSSWIADVRFADGTRHLELPGEIDGHRTLRQQFVPASNGTDRVITGADIPKAVTYRMVQSILFERGWDWGGKHEGGKIGFGLSGGTSPTGNVVDTAGFSARLMWQGNKDGSARMGMYTYNADRPKARGAYFLFEDFVAPVGGWFEIAFEIQLNSSIRTSDGRMRAWVDGKLVLDHEDIGWQTSGDIPMVDNLYYASFFGGGTNEWSPQNTTYAQIRDVCWAAVVDGHSGIDPDNGKLLAPEIAKPDNAGL